MAFEIIRSDNIYQGRVFGVRCDVISLPNGNTLVEAGDLTVRNERVLLKTLGGLLPVDVILRRQSDLRCDPLELRGAPLMGVAGLLQAVRAGNVAVANGLGASLVESPAFLPYLPRLCRELLHEDLQLPSAPTWWCGEEQSLRFVLDRLDDVVIRSMDDNVAALRAQTRTPAIGTTLNYTLNAAREPTPVCHPLQQKMKER